jgi:hypothetical protein
MYDRGVFVLREEPHLSALGSHESMADAFHHFLHRISATLMYV